MSANGGSTVGLIERQREYFNGTGASKGFQMFSFR